MKTHDIKKWQLFIVGFTTFGIIRLSSSMLKNGQQIEGIITISIGVILLIVFYLLISRKSKNKDK